MKEGRFERVGFVLLMLAALIPLFAGTAFWNPDGPRQTELGQVALALLTEPDGPVSTFYAFNDRIIPNLSHQVFMAPLLQSAPRLAERLAWLLYLFGVPLAFRWVARASTTQGVVWVVLPLLWSLSFAMGLLNFLISLTLYVLGLGFALHSDERPWPSVAALGLGGLLLLFTHPLTFWVTGASVGVVHLWRFAVDRDASSLAKRLGLTAACTAPAVLLALSFSVGGESNTLWIHPVSERLRWLLTMDYLLNYGLSDIAPAALELALLTGLGLTALRARRGLRPSDAYLAVALFGLVFFLFVPDRASGGSVIARRAQVFFWLPLALWTACEPLTRTVRPWVFGGVGLAVALQLGIATTAQRNFDRDAREALSVVPDDIRGDTLVPVLLTRNGLFVDGSQRVHRGAGLSAIGSDIARQTGAIHLLCWQAAHDGFIVRYRPGMHAFPGEDDVVWEQTPPPLDLRGFEERTGQSIDHILVFGSRDPSSEPGAAAVLTQVEEGWTRTAVSETGLARWYTRKE